MKKYIIVCLAVILSSCSAKLLMPAEKDATAISSKYPGTTLADLNKGKAIYETKCTQCHPAKKPSAYTEAQWKHEVPDMAAKAKRKGKVEISEDEQTLILKYVLAMMDKKK